MNQKKLSLALASALCLSTLCACGDTATPADGTSVAAADGAAVQIEFYNQKSEIVDYVDELIAQFESENPGIKVAQTQVPNANTVLNSRIASGDLPDIIGCYPDTAEFPPMVAAGTFLDLSGDQVLANVAPAYLEGIKIDGKDYAVPLTMNAWGIFYNKTQFAALGIDPPATWADFLTVCETIAADGVTPLAPSLKDGWTVGHVGEAIILGMAGLEEGTAFFSDPAVNFADSPYYAEFVRRLDMFVDYSSPNATATGYNEACAEFAFGNALMTPMGIWALPLFEQAGMTDEIGMFPFPGDSGAGTVQCGVDLAVGIGATTDHPEAAKAFVSFLASAPAAQYLADREGSPSCIEGVTTDIPATEGVTSCLFEEGRNAGWFHFGWEAGVDTEWGSEAAAYCVTRDADAFAQALDRIYKKS